MEQDEHRSSKRFSPSWCFNDGGRQSDITSNSPIGVVFTWVEIWWLCSVDGEESIHIRIKMNLDKGS